MDHSEIRQRQEFSSTAVRILGVPVHGVTMDGTLAQVKRFMAGSRLHQIATVNPEFVMTAQQDTEFRRVLETADLCIPDGVGLLWAARRRGQPLPERVAGSDLVYEIARLAAEEGWRLFLLGAAEGVAEEAGAILQDRYPGLLIAGTYAGSPDPAENETIVRLINEARAQIVYVAYGAPRQDKWIARNRETLPTVRLAIGIGGSLDFITGRARRPPRWAQRAGVEWLVRLFMEPWRWRRMTALPRFVVKILTTSNGNS
ncbi:MAG: WecB/TagA/CpsF family glycosyltransferase [Chloroflexota bacterium]|jgi:N-acetylglucosaminyldiphosphoundecaprenol N-acetyl-beta-D-mannosaminyltransferase